MKVLVSLFSLSLFLLISGCSSESALIKQYKTVYEPEKKEGVISYYVSGLPMGAYGDDKYSIMFNLKPATILDDNCLRLWLLYENINEEEYLIEPTKITKIELWKYGIKRYELSPESPLNILTQIEEDKQQNLIMESIGSALKNLSTSNTKIKINGKDKIEIKDKDQKIQEITEENVNRINNINDWYDIYSESINNGLLRKNTLFKNKSVNGYIYFKIPIEDKNVKDKWGGNFKEEISLENYEIRLKVATLYGVKEIVFKQVAGE